MGFPLEPEGITALPHDYPQPPGQAGDAEGRVSAEASSPFLKKRTKKLLFSGSWRQREWRSVRLDEPASEEQEFFGSFLRKRTACMGELVLGAA
jgi:hypothetical protein